jgi:hypothetical protein
MSKYLGNTFLKNIIENTARIIIYVAMYANIGTYMFLAMKMNPKKHMASNNIRNSAKERNCTCFIHNRSSATPTKTKKAIAHHDPKRLHTSIRSR